MSIARTASDFSKAIDFIYEIDGLKNIFRMTKITTDDRFENDAEHSWHISVMAHTLRSFFGDGFGEIDVDRAVKMLLLHDVVELYAGDTYCYDSKAAEDKQEREFAAAEKIFGLLPEDIKEDFQSLWIEFDREETPDAIFASIMDKIQPLLLNYKNNGISWITNGITRSQVEHRMDIALKKGPKLLSDYVFSIIDKAVKKGYLFDR